MSFRLDQPLIVKDKTKVLVTGADGMLGNHIVRELVNRRYNVTCLIERNRSGASIKDLPVKIVRGDICDEETLDPLFRENDFVIHTAGITAMWPARSEKLWKINYEAVVLMVSLTRRHGIQRFVHIGTATSFGHGNLEKPGDENFPYTNHIFRIDYHDSKYRAQEYLLEEFRKDGFPVIILNPTFMIGKYDSGNGSNKMVLYLYKRKFPGYSPGGKNFVNVNDVAHAAVNALKIGRTGECYITGGQNLTYKDSFRLMTTVMKVTPPRLPLPRFISVSYGALQSIIAGITKKPPNVTYKMARIGCEHCYYSPEKAIRELNMPQTPLEEGVRDAIDWFREQRMI